MNFKLTIAGLGINGIDGYSPLICYFAADNDTKALTYCGRISQSISVSHGMTVEQVVGLTTHRVVIADRNCQPNYCW